MDTEKEHIGFAVTDTDPGLPDNESAKCFSHSFEALTNDQDGPMVTGGPSFTVTIELFTPNSGKVDLKQNT